MHFFRPYKRFRKQKSLREEKHLNVHNHLYHTSLLPCSELCPDFIKDFKHLVNWLSSTYHISPRLAIRLSYTPAYAKWLVLLLAIPRQRLSYHMVWKCRFPRFLIVAAWHESRFLSRNSAALVQRKLNNFLKTSPLVNPAHFYIRIPSHTPFLLQKTRRCVAFIINFIRRHIGLHLAQYFRV